MAFGLAEFKAVFGKKPAPVDTVDPKTRYDTLRAKVEPKIQAGMKLGDQRSLDTWAALKLRVDRKDWNAAADVLEEAGRLIPADLPRARDLRKKLDAAFTLAQQKFAPQKPAALEGPYADGQKALEEDRFDDAAESVKSILEVLKEIDRLKSLYDARAAEAERARNRIAGWVMAQPAASRPMTELQDVEKKIADISAAVNLRTYDVALTLLDDLTKRAQALGGAADGESGKAAYEQRLAQCGPQCEAVAQQLGSGALGKPPVGLLQAPAQAFLDAWKAAGDAAAKDDFASAETALTDAVTRLGELHDAARQERLDLRNATISDPGNFFKWPATAPADLKPRQPVLKKAEADMMAARKEMDHLRGLAIWLGVEADWKTLATYFNAESVASNKKAADQAAQVLKDNQALATRYEQMLRAQDADALRTAMLDKGFKPAVLRAVPGGPKMLDDLIKGMGPKVDTPEKREIVTLAMKARFGLQEVTGGDDGKGLSSKALPRMYKLMAMLPEEHVAGNDLIQSIERQKGSDTSTHSESERKIVLKAGKTGKEGGTFDDTTLHEIGHGVDAKFKFMDTNGGAVKYGGWRKESFDDIADKVAGEALGFYADFKTVPADILRKYVRAVLSGADPKPLQAQFELVNGGKLGDGKALATHAAVVAAEKGYAALVADKKNKDTDLTRDLFFASAKLIKDPEPMRSIVTAITKAVAEGAKPADAVKAKLEAVQVKDPMPAADVWKQMAAHRAIDFASNVLLKPGDNGLWSQGDSGARKYAVNGRVYQEAYKGDWVSYVLSARATAVCDYQFRHRMEWFAECYSRYFLKTLSPKHPLAAWLDTQVPKPAKA